MQTTIEVNQEILENNNSNNKIEKYTFIGELDETNSDSTFSKIYSQIEDFSKKIIFNLEGLEYMNSKSIGYIADVFSKAKEKDGMLILTNLREEIDDTLDLVGVKKFIKTFENDSEAIDFLNSLDLKTSLSNDDNDDKEI